MTVGMANGREAIGARLASANEEDRLEAVRAIGVDVAESLLDLVFQAFGDPSWRVRKEATDLFLRLPVSRDLIGEVIELLHAEENAGLRNAAVDILVRMGRDAVPFLLDQARCPDHDVRKFIVDILGEIADPRAVPVLLEALADSDGNVRAAAAENLGKLSSREAVPALLDAMQYPDVLLRFTILDALAKIGEAVPLARLAPFRDEKLLRKALIDCLGAVGDVSAVAELVSGLADPMRNVRDASLLALVALGDRYPQEISSAMLGQDFSSATSPVVEYLADGQSQVLRMAAVRVLGWMASPSAVLPLVERLSDESLQHETLGALIKICLGHPQTLIDAWPRVPLLSRAYLAYVFGEAGCVAGVPLLREALGAGDLSLEQMAAHALGRLGGIAELRPLVDCLRRDNPDVREAAARSLSLLGSRYPGEILGALEPLLTDGDTSRRALAVGILGRLDGAAVAGRLEMALKDPEPTVRCAALKALAGAASGEYLLAIQLALTDEDTEVRRAAAEILGTTENPEAVHGLRLALRDEDMWVRAAAVRSLGRLGGAAEAETVGALLKDPVGLVSIAALETLADSCAEAAAPQIAAALDHPDEEVVRVALELIGRHGAGPWLATNAETLVNHPSWVVRAHCVRLLPELLGERARPILERRLGTEGDDLVRQQLDDALRSLTASR